MGQRHSLDHHTYSAIAVPAIAILALVLLIPASPWYTTVPTRDPGVFLHIGDQILEGKLPYRDVWDHKPPLIFYINALGLWIVEQSFWGVWILEVVSLFVAGLFGFRVLRKVFGHPAAAIGTLVWMVQLGQLLACEGGNFTEEFALQFQFVALYLFWRMEKAARRPILPAFLIGLAGGGAFFLKQNLIGLWVAMVIYLALVGTSSGSWRQRRAQIVALLGGGLSVALGIGFLFYGAGAFGSFWEAAFEYNFDYVETTEGLAARLTAVVSGAGLHLLSGILFLALAGWLLGISRLYQAKDRHQYLHKNAVVGLALLNLPIEVGLTSVSGRIYPHYSIPWLPSLAVLAVFFVQHTLRINQTMRWQPKGLRYGIRIVLAALAALIAALMTTGTGYLFSQRLAVDEYEQSRTELAEYIMRNTQPDEYVLLWGAETQLYFITQRDAPTRFVYQYPLYTEEYQDIDMVEEFLRDMETQRPVLIVDASFGTDKIPPLSRSRQEDWSTAWDESYGPLPIMDVVYEYIAIHYQQVESIPGFDGDIYRLWNAAEPLRKNP